MSADLLGQLDDDPLGAADVAEPEAVPVVDELADELGPQAAERVLDVVDREAEVAQAPGVRRRVPGVAHGRRCVELDQLEPAVAVRALHHRRVVLDPLEPDDAVHLRAADREPALHLEPELGEELDRAREIVDDDADVIHPLKGHALDARARARAAWRTRWSRSATFAARCEASA